VLAEYKYKTEFLLRHGHKKNTGHNEEADTLKKRNSREFGGKHSLRSDVLRSSLNSLGALTLLTNPAVLSKFSSAELPTLTRAILNDENGTHYPLYSTGQKWRLAAKEAQSAISSIEPPRLFLNSDGADFREVRNQIGLNIERGEHWLRIFPARE
jgi:hypothetical protein